MAFRGSAPMQDSSGDTIQQETTPHSQTQDGHGELGCVPTMKQTKCRWCTTNTVNRFHKCPSSSSSSSPGFLHKMVERPYAGRDDVCGRKQRDRSLRGVFQPTRSSTQVHKKAIPSRVPCECRPTSSRQTPASRGTSGRTRSGSRR